jgi:hypothetical protein
MVFDSILKAHHAGFSVIPVVQGGKKPALPSWKKYQSSKPSLEDLETWFSGGGKNYGLVQGSVSGNTLVLDIEEERAARDLLVMIQERSHGNLLRQVESTYCVITPSGGRHLYFRTKSSQPGSVLARRPRKEGNEWSPLIETRWEGNYVVGEGCLNTEKGGAYTLYHGTIENIQLLLPDDLVALFSCCSALCRKGATPAVTMRQAALLKTGDAASGEIDEREYPYLASVLSRLVGCKRGNNGWNACCPNPGHGRDGNDSRPSLWTTVGSNGFIYFHCRAGCSKKDVASSLGLSPGMLYPPPGEKTPPNLMERSKPAMTRDQALLAAEVYSKLLQRLGLSRQAGLHMAGRGVSLQQVQKLGYSSFNPKMPQDLRAVLGLHEEYGTRLLEVPGFILGQDGVPTLSMPGEGILVPIRDTTGRVLALKARLLGNSQQKFKLLVSKSAPGHNHSIHFPLGYPGRNGDFRITEGEMKADLSTLFSGIYTIGCPGLHSLFYPIEFLSFFWPESTVMLAPDFPDLMKPSVAQLVRKALILYEDARFHTFLEIWPRKNGPAPKGIDDALKDGTEILQLEASDGIDFLDRIISGEMDDIYSNN